mmetsp:Transcript_124105/g.356419  ORF Transcript_124105/g.356419 Transcript_124105/m.356419 type:complete len:381 (-) Transcript_124105:1138-2280(-)
MNSSVQFARTSLKIAFVISGLPSSNLCCNMRQPDWSFAMLYTLLTKVLEANMSSRCEILKPLPRCARRWSPLLLAAAPPPPPALPPAWATCESDCSLPRWPCTPSERCMPYAGSLRDPALLPSTPVSWPPPQRPAAPSPPFEGAAAISAAKAAAAAAFEGSNAACHEYGTGMAVLAVASPKLQHPAAVGNPAAPSNGECLQAAAAATAAYPPTDRAAAVAALPDGALVPPGTGTGSVKPPPCSIVDAWLGPVGTGMAGGCCKCCEGTCAPAACCCATAAATAALWACNALSHGGLGDLGKWEPWKPGADGVGQRSKPVAAAKLETPPATPLADAPSPPPPSGWPCCPNSDASMEPARWRTISGEGSIGFGKFTFCSAYRW